MRIITKKIEIYKFDEASNELKDKNMQRKIKIKYYSYKFRYLFYRDKLIQCAKLKFSHLFYSSSL